MIFDLASVECKLGYNFKNPDIIRVAFTHASYSNEKRGEKNNERLEFLGDSVLGFVVTDYLFRRGNDDEGCMTEYKQALVSFKPLSTACKRLKLHNYLLIGENVTITEKLQENLMESVIGALYLDGGLEKAREFIYKNIIDKINVKESERFIDYKSQLNELSSKQKFTVSYETVGKKGMDNDPSYTVSIFIGGKKFATATAKGKKQNAEQMVAKKAIEKINKQKR